MSDADDTEDAFDVMLIEDGYGAAVIAVPRTSARLDSEERQILENVSRTRFDLEIDWAREECRKKARDHLKRRADFREGVAFGHFLRSLQGVEIEDYSGSYPNAPLGEN